MKKSVRMMAVAMALLMVALVLASCGEVKLSGTYKCDDTKVSDVTLTFDKDGNVTAKGTLLLISVEVTGTYSIKDDKITMTFGEDKFSLGGEQTFEKDGNTIKIGGVSYTKQ